MSDDLLSRLAASPDVYVQKFDAAREAYLLIQFDRDAYRAASFLDDRILTPATKGGWASLARVTEAARQVREPRPVHFIFHTGHVGSTLVSRLLDETGVVLSLREPLPLRSLADAQDLLNQPESLLSEAQFSELRDTLMRLWGRAYAESRAVVVKATSSAGRVAGVLLANEPEARAIYLNLSAEPYLATLLAGRNSPMDLRGHGPARIRQLRTRVGAELRPLHALSLGELAALSWLTETWNQRDAVRLAGERVLAVDFEQFLANTVGGVERLLQWFGLANQVGRAAEIARSPVMTRYSKAVEFEYSPQTRAQLLNESRRIHRDEIQRGLAWIENLARSDAGVAEILSFSQGSSA
jgi:hypothetical protein